MERLFFGAMDTCNFPIRAAAACCLLFFSGTAFGLITGNFTGIAPGDSFANPEPAFTVIDSDEAREDAVNWHRHGVTSTVRVRFTTGSFSESGTYRVCASLLDETGAVIPVMDVVNGGGGKEKVVYSTERAVSVGVLTPRSVDFLISADPAIVLGSSKRYHFECELQQKLAGSWTTIAAGGNSSSPELPAFHFQSSDPDDSAYNIQTALTDLHWTRKHLVATDAGRDRFLATARLIIARYDDYEDAPKVGSTEIRADFDLHEAGGGPEVPLENDGIVAVRLKQASNDDSSGRPLPSFIDNYVLEAGIVPLEQLQSRSKTYELTVRFEHIEEPGVTQPDEEGALPAERLLHFNGTLRFGSLDTEMIGVANDPPVSGLNAAGVVTLIQLENLGGSISTRPDLGFGSGISLSAILNDAGLATVQVGTEEIIPVEGSGPVLGSMGNLEVEFGTPQLTPTGPQVASALLRFPQGLGVIVDTSVDRHHAEHRWLFSSGISLDENIQLASPLSASLGPNARMFDEGHPLIYDVSKFDVDLAGTIEFTASACEHVSQPAYDALAALPNSQLEDPATMRERFSNDGYLRFTTFLSANPVVITASAEDGSARTSTVFETDPGEFTCHFPLGAKLNWVGNEYLQIQEGAVDYGRLLAPGPVSLEYDLACGDDPCTAGASSLTTLSLSPTLGELVISPTGGIATGGDAGPTSLSWGYKGDGMGHLADYTHRTDQFPTARFYMPGYRLMATENPLRGLVSYSATADYLSPGVLLLEGYSEGSVEPVRPETPGYRNGDGDYAGMTYTVEDPGHRGASKIAGNSSDYGYNLLPSSSKYYARRSGISGRHVAVDGSFDPVMQLYGFDFAVAQFQLTFLSSENVDSWFDGQLFVPPPSDFSQNFKGLMLTCTGDITGELGMDPNDTGEKPLRDWNSVFQPRAFQFEPVSPPGEGNCYPPRTLIVGVTTEVAHVPGLLAGQFEFLKDGRLGTALTGNPEYDSRLGIPASIKVDGPDGGQYTLHPSTKLYFTDPTAVPDGIGQAAFAGLLDVPYFEDLKVHFLSSAQPNPNAAIYLCGGWEDNGTGDTFFNRVGFDAGHVGFPPDLGKPEYLSPDESTDGEFLVHARQSLFGLIPLDYPLRWSPAGRYFRTMNPDKRDLVILKDTYNQIDFLGPEDAEISFGAQYEGLPQISLANMAFDAIDEQLGAARAITDALTGEVSGALNDGIDDLAKLVGDNLDAVLEEALDGIEADVMLPIHGRLAASYENAYDAGLTFNEWRTIPADSANSIINEAFATSGGAVTSVRDRLSALRDANNDVTSMLHRVDEALVRAILAIDSVSGQVKIHNGEPAIDPPEVDALLPGLLYKDGAEYEVLQNLVAYLMRDLLGPELGPALEPLVDAILSGADEKLNAILADISPTLDRVGETLGEIRNVLDHMRGRLADGEEIFNHFNEIIDEALMPLDEISAMMASLETATYEWIQDQAISAGIDLDVPLNVYVGYSIFTEFSADDLAVHLRLELRDALLASEFMHQIQYALRQQVYDLELAMRSAVDSVFEEINRVIKDLIKESLGPLDDAIAGLVGSINEFTGAGGVDGYAHVQGDSLKRLRIDANWQMKVPDDLEFHAYVEILCYDSGDDFAPSACLAPGEKAMEVRIGVDDVALGWISPDLRASIGLKFSMNTTGTVYPKGIAGYFIMTGALDFQSFTLKELNATVGFTIDPNLGDGVDGREAYLGASIRMGISGYEAAGAFFIGRTCSLDPLLVIDKDVAELLGSPPFTGGYVYGEVWVPVSEVVLGIPASCFFNISAGVGAGAFYFVEGPTFGGKMLLGVSGEALCVVSIKGEVRLVGLMQGGELRMRGKGSLTGKAGWCPFCLKFKKSATVTYQGGSWDVDL